MRVCRRRRRPARRRALRGEINATVGAAAAFAGISLDFVDGLNSVLLMIIDGNSRRAARGARDAPVASHPAGHGRRHGDDLPRDAAAALTRT